LRQKDFKTDKIKRGAFQMPPFPPDIQDLIQKMLVVDPTQRITIAQIKSHAAFRRGLVPSYVLPSPLPFAQYTAPIDVTLLPSPVLSTLAQIGFSDATELANQLHDSENSAAKVFTMILLNMVDLSGLANSGLPPFVGAELAFAPVLLGQPKPSDAIPREGYRGGEAAPYGDYSAGNPVWNRERTMAAHVYATASFDTCKQPLWALMTALQQDLGRLAYSWFHPDPGTIYVRAPDGNAYYSIVGTFRSALDVTVTVNAHKGDASQFFQLVRDSLEVARFSMEIKRSDIENCGEK
jgi:BR serine/threonine kinase